MLRCCYDEHASHGSDTDSSEGGDDDHNCKIWLVMMQWVSQFP